ncbi:MAG: family transposase [Bacteroidota bacterium]|jgi:putative transposase
MSTHTQILYHIVFATKNRKPTIEKSQKKRLFGYIFQLLTNKKCHLYRINGVEDHIHILTHIHPTISISALVKDIKVSTSVFLKKELIFKNFDGWQEGYGAFSEAIKSKDRLINYIKNQEKHHEKKSFFDEYKALLEEHEIVFDEKFLL